MQNIKILYVEDEPFLGKIVRESLESRNFEVCLVADGQLALEAFRQFQPHVCVLDVMLSNRDGFSLGQDIRAISPQIPILFLTAKNQTQDVLQGFAAGGNDYVRKPFSMEELIVRIQNLLNLSQSTPPALPGEGLPLGRFRFLENEQELRLDGQTRKLSYREAQLLNVFASQPNALITRKEVLEKIWGNDSFFNSRNLDVYVTRLREYLREDERVQILTLKGVGYRLVF